MEAYLALSSYIFRPIQQIDLAIPHRRARIEGGELLPADDAVGHRREEGRARIRSDDRIYAPRFVERSKHPVAALPVRRWRKQQARKEQEEPPRRVSHPHNLPDARSVR